MRSRFVPSIVEAMPKSNPTSVETETLGVEVASYPRPTARERTELRHSPHALALSELPGRRNAPTRRSTAATRRARCPGPADTRLAIPPVATTAPHLVQPAQVASCKTRAPHERRHHARLQRERTSESSPVSGQRISENKAIPRLRLMVYGMSVAKTVPNDRGINDQVSLRDVGSCPNPGEFVPMWAEILPSRCCPTSS